MVELGKGKRLVFKRISTNVGGKWKSPANRNIGEKAVHC